MIRTLSETPGPSGFEQPIAERAAELLAPLVDRVRLDRLGNVIYPASRLFTAPPPEARVSRAFCRLMQDRLRDLLAEMADPALPVRRTQDRTTCSYCDFRNICGR